MQDQCFHPSVNRTGKLIVGILLTLFGIVLLLNNIGLLSPFAKSVIFSWQMLLIVIGILNFAAHKRSVFGLLLILIGVFFLIPHFIHVPFNFTQLFWPIILIILGVYIIIRRTSNSHTAKNQFYHHPKASFISETEDYNTSDYIDDVNVFGGNKKNISTKEFKGGRITCIFGGSEIDFTGSELADGLHVIHVSCIFGGTSIIMPPHWKVRLEVASVLGGFSDKRPNISSAEPAKGELIIKGLVIFGGGEIKSFR